MVEPNRAISGAMDNLDLNLLVTLDVLLDEGSVVGAAKRLQLSASAMSRALRFSTADRTANVGFRAWCGRLEQSLGPISAEAVGEDDFCGEIEEVQIGEVRLCRIYAGAHRIERASGRAAQGAAGYNWGYYSNPEVDKLLEQGTSEPDEAKRMASYAKAQELIAEEAPALFLYEKNYRLPMNQSVEGFVFNGVWFETFDFYALTKKGA